MKIVIVKIRVLLVILFPTSTGGNTEVPACRQRRSKIRGKVVCAPMEMLVVVCCVKMFVVNRSTVCMGLVLLL